MCAEAVGDDAWGEVLIGLSHHPARSGRPAGTYQVSYRFGTRPAGRRTEGLLAVVDVPVRVDGWTEVVLDLTADVARAWPDMVAEDNGLNDLWLGASSASGQPASVCFSTLRIARDASGDRPLAVQARVFDAYASTYPGVAVRQGLEVSISSAHSNWFGGRQHLLDYTSPEAARYVDGSHDAEYLGLSAELIHGYGGLGSLNHPFGADPTSTSEQDQDAERRRLAAELIASRAYGMDILEVGYQVRGGATLATHLALWDTLSRAGVWLTGNGVNDSHGGRNNSWRTHTNRFVTSVLADSTAEPDLLAALAAGRAFVHEVGGFGGLLEINVGTCAMGSVSVRAAARTRPLTIRATDLPRGATVRVVQGPVDHGTALEPGTVTAAVLPATAFATGSSTVALDTSRSSFARVEVYTAQGRMVAFSNPVWLLKEQPPVPPAGARRPVL